MKRMSSSAAIIPLHLLRRVHSDQVEAAAEHGLCGGAKGEATGAYVGVFDQDAVDGIELVEACGEGLEVGWDGVHLTLVGCIVYDAGKVEELEHEEALFGREIPCREFPQCLGARACSLEDTRYPGVGVLHVEVARHVLPHLVEQLVEGHDVAGPLADLHLIPSTNQLHQPYYLHVQEVSWHA